MMKKHNFISRRILLIVSFFVLLVSLTSCKTAGDLTGNLQVDDIYTKAGNYQVTKGELWNELKWNASTEITSKFNEVIVSEYFDKIELVMDKTYSTLSAEESELFADEAEYNTLHDEYTERLTAYVIQDVYNFAFSTKSLEELAEDIEDVKHYDKIKLLYTYSDEIFSQYNVTKINGKTIKEICEAEEYITLAQTFKNIYYTSLAKELLAYAHLEELIEEAYEEIDLEEDEDDIGYFTKNDFTSKFKDEFTNQGDLNLILIRFASEDEFKATLRSFGLVEYDNALVYIPGPEGMSYSDYCDYYDDLTTSDIKNPDNRVNTRRLEKLIFAWCFPSLVTWRGDVLCVFPHVSVVSRTRSTLSLEVPAGEAKGRLDSILHTVVSSPGLTFVHWPSILPLITQ